MLCQLHVERVGQAPVCFTAAASAEQATYLSHAGNGSSAACISATNSLHKQSNRLSAGSPEWQLWEQQQDRLDCGRTVLLDKGTKDCQHVTFWLHQAPGLASSLTKGSQELM